MAKKKVKLYHYFVSYFSLGAGKEWHGFTEMTMEGKISSFKDIEKIADVIKSSNDKRLDQVIILNYIQLNVCPTKRKTKPK